MDDAHHIVVDSASNSNEAGKTRLNIKSCKFACDELKSIKVIFDDSSSSIVVFDVNNQVFNYDESKQKENESNEAKSKSLFITTMSLTIIAILVVIGVASIVSMRKSEIEANNDKNDPLNHPLDSMDLKLLNKKTRTYPISIFIIFFITLVSKICLLIDIFFIVVVNLSIYYSKKKKFL